MYNVTIEITSTGYQVKNLSYLNHILVKIVSSSFLAPDEKELDREVRTKDFEAIYEDRKYSKNPYTWTYRFFKFSNVFYSNVFCSSCERNKKRGFSFTKEKRVISGDISSYCAQNRVRVMIREKNIRARCCQNSFSFLVGVACSHISSVKRAHDAVNGFVDTVIWWILRFKWGSYTVDTVYSIKD